jgi:hypothetical protein
VLQPFVYDESQPYAAGQHRGVDIGADAAGENVVAPAAGTVSFAGTVPTSGKTITIETADGYSVTLTHLGTILVAEGAPVAEEDPVGTIGPSGTAEVDGPYVHLGIRVTADPNGYVDPLGLLPAPAVESPPADGGSTASQPTASGGATLTTPATTAAPAPVASVVAPADRTPADSLRGTNLRTRVTRTSQHTRAHARSARPAVQRPGSSQRPVVVAPPKAEPSVPSHRTKPRVHAGESAISPRRTVVEPTASRGSAGPGVGHGPRVATASVDVQPRRQEPGVLLSLVCNGAAALVAMAAALAAARGRRRLESRPGAQVLHLPRRSREHRRAA